jgi:hypothetical protein
VAELRETGLEFVLRIEKTRPFEAQRKRRGIEDTHDGYPPPSRFEKRTAFPLLAARRPKFTVSMIHTVPQAGTA